MKNKHGLSRYIPTNIKKIVRKNSGYGCVVCGNAVVEYEHVDPEWVDAKTHNASKMTLLCPNCHAKVTRGAWSKEKIKDHMKKPWSVVNNKSHDELEIPSSKPEILIGNSSFSTETVIIKAFGKELVKFSKPEAKYTSFRLSAEFYDINNKLVARIKNNIIESILGDQDVEFVGKIIRIKPYGSIENALELERSGGENIRILNLNMYFNGLKFKIDGNGSFTVYKNGMKILDLNDSNLSASGGSIFTFN